MQKSVVMIDAEGDYDPVTFKGYGHANVHVHAYFEFACTLNSLRAQRWMPGVLCE